MMALVLGMVSCQTEPEGLDVIVGGEVDTVVTVTIPEAETRAITSSLGVFNNGILDDPNVTMRYILEIYYGDESRDRLVDYSDGTEVAFPVRLVPDRHYNFVVWADVVTKENDATEFSDDDNHYNTEDLRAITLKDWDAMDETRDAFTGYFNTVKDGDKTPYNGSKAINIPLTRPFAKLRVITTDFDELAKYGIKATSGVVSYSSDYSGRASFDAYEGKASEAITTFLGDSYNIVAYDSEDGGDEHTIFSDYIFASTNGDIVKFDLDIYDLNGGRIKYNNFNTDIRVKRNYITTIKGDVLTDGNNIKVEVEDGGKFDGEENWPDENAEQLAYVAMFGGEVTLTEDITLTQPLEIAEGANVVINLGDKTITGALAKDSGAIIENNGILTIVGGTLENTAANGDAVINNTGELVLESVKIKGAPLADGGYSAYAVISSGKMTINDGTEVSADRGCLKASGSGETTINGGLFVNNDIGARSLTSHVVDVEDGGNNTLTINGGTFKHLHTATSGGVVICNRTRGTVYVNGGNFSGGNYYGNDNLSDYGYGGTFSVTGGTYSARPAAKYIATGYKAIAADGIYYVLPETIANAAEAENVTAVTESTDDIATALATNNGEATLFMWNDVAYIAKYGEVVITSAADEATTVRGVVEYSTELTSATVADGIEVVGNRTFRKCTNLETVALPNTLTEIGPAVFQSCSKLANITIPESVTTIGEGAFAECTSLTSINIPAGITRLEKDVLRNTGLTSIEIPASVNYIGTYAFRDCEELTEIIINAPVFTVESDTFLNAAGPFPAYVIKVANAEMKAYLESRLSAHQKTFITVVGPTTVSNADELKAAIINGGFIEFANDITVDEWIMFSEDLNIGDGTIITVDEIDVTIDGKGHTLTVNSIESAGNNDQLFQGASVLNISNLTIKYADGLTTGGLGMHSGVIKNVHFIGGGSAASSAAIFPNNGVIKVEDCIFDTNGVAIYFEDERDNLTVTGCTFNQKDNKNVILLYGDVKFTDNIINSGRTVNVVSGSPVVTGNNFNNVRLKVYGAATATISNNIINVLEFNGTTYASTFSGNTLSTAAQAVLDGATKVN